MLDVVHVATWNKKIPKPLPPLWPIQYSSRIINSVNRPVCMQTLVSASLTLAAGSDSTSFRECL